MLKNKHYDNIVFLQEYFHGSSNPYMLHKKISPWNMFMTMHLIYPCLFLTLDNCLILFFFFFTVLPLLYFYSFFGLNDSTLFKCSNISYKFWNILTKFFHKIEHLLTHGSQLNSYERPIWNWINAPFVLFFRYFLWELENILRYNLTSTISWQHSWNDNTSNSEWCWGDKNKINHMLGKVKRRKECV